jgi:hypothetical protein
MKERRRRRKEETHTKREVIEVGRECVKKQ